MKLIVRQIDKPDITVECDPQTSINGLREVIKNEIASMSASASMRILWRGRDILKSSSRSSGSSGIQHVNESSTLESIGLQDESVLHLVITEHVEPSRESASQVRVDLHLSQEEVEQIRHVCSKVFQINQEINSLCALLNVGVNQENTTVLVERDLATQSGIEAALVDGRVHKAVAVLLGKRVVSLTNYTNRFGYKVGRAIQAGIPDGANSVLEEIQKFETCQEKLSDIRAQCLTFYREFIALSQEGGVLHRVRDKIQFIPVDHADAHGADSGISVGQFQVFASALPMDIPFPVPMPVPVVPPTGQPATSPTAQQPGQQRTQSAQQNLSQQTSGQQQQQSAQGQQQSASFQFAGDIQDAPGWLNGILQTMTGAFVNAVNQSPGTASPSTGATVNNNSRSGQVSQSSSAEQEQSSNQSQSADNIEPPEID
ncbi:hypothetical protein MIR68_001852 [Amoeboaphelidium protococcarum]|nr:hypothetical protein MIR68_001852 [Amoeboaphelidium protococcarum]